MHLINLWSQTQPINQKQGVEGEIAVRSTRWSEPMTGNPRRGLGSTRVAARELRDFRPEASLRIGDQHAPGCLGFSQL